MSIKMTGEQLKLMSSIFPNMTIEEFIELISKRGNK